jgi:ribosomal protein S27AE
MKNFVNKICSNCGSLKFKKWEQLSEDEKFLVNRLPDSQRFSLEQRKKQRFCGRCFYVLEEIEIDV